METIRDGVQAAKGFMWDKFCDRVEHNTVSAERRSADGETGCLLCPEDSFISQIDSNKIDTPCCAKRLDASCADDWMRRSNARRTGLEAGDRFRPVKCPVCHEPLTALTVQDLAVEKTLSTLRDTAEDLTEICRLSFESFQRANQSAPSEDVDATVDATETASTSSESTQDESQQLAHRVERKIMTVLPDQLSQVAMSQPRHPQLRDARNTTLAVMMLQQIGQVSAQLSQADEGNNFTKLPVAMSFYSVIESFINKFNEGAKQETFALQRADQAQAGDDKVQRNAAAEYIDYAYRATVMVGNQLLEEVKLHVDQAKRYQAAVESARIGIEMPDEMSASEQSAATEQWIAFTQAASVQKVFEALSNNAQALITIVDSVRQTDAFTDEAAQNVSADMAAKSDQLKDVLVELDDFVQRLKRKEEGAADHEAAINTIGESLYGQLRSTAESLARQALRIVEGPVVVSAGEQISSDVVATDASVAQLPAEDSVKPEAVFRAPPKDVSASSAEVAQRAGELAKSSGSSAHAGSNSARRLAANG